VERRWEASAGAGAVHAQYVTQDRIKGDELLEDSGLRPTMPWYLRHTLRSAVLPHAQTMMRVRCSTTHFAGSLDGYAAPTAPHACRRCTSGDAGTVEHVPLHCTAPAPLCAEPPFAPLFQPLLPSDATVLLPRAFLPRVRIHGACSWLAIRCKPQRSKGQGCKARMAALNS
jgi:hypothetical protein